MEKFILRQKWLGLLIVAFISLGLALHLSGQVSTAYIEAEPIIKQEAGYFLPIRFFGGEIVSPKDALIERTYGTSSSPYKIVLNTEVEDLDISNLTSGIYITRNKIYSYNAKKGEAKIQSLAKIPDGEITKSDLTTLMNKLGKYLKPLLSLVIAFSLMIYFGIVSLFYSLLLHWLFKKLYNADFALTLRVNTLACVALFTIDALFDMSFGFIVTLLLLGACNYLANILLNEKKKS